MLTILRFRWLSIPQGTLKAFFCFVLIWLCLATKASLRIEGYLSFKD